MPNVDNYMEQGGETWNVGGTMNILSGGVLDVNSGGALKIDGTAVTSNAAELNKLYGVAVTAAEMYLRSLTATLTLGTAGQVYVVCPFSGNVTKVYSVINGALTTADEVLTVKNNAGTSMGTITITQSGSAAGDVDSLTPSSNNAVTAGQVIEIETDGGNGSATICTLTILIDIT